MSGGFLFGLFLVLFKTVNLYLHKVGGKGTGRSKQFSQVKSMIKAAFHFKGSSKIRGLFLAIFLLFSTTYLCAAELYIEGGIDQDGDGNQEFLIWSQQPGDSTITYSEMTEDGLLPIWAWSYRPKFSARITDVKLADVTLDGAPDIVAISRSIYGSNDAKEPWLFVFPSVESGYPDKPFSFSDPLDGSGRVRPTSLDILLIDQVPTLIIGQGTPDRKALTFQISISGQKLSLENLTEYTAPLVTSGYGQVYAQGLATGQENLVVLFSMESNLLKTALFTVNSAIPIASDILVLDGARSMIGSGITHNNMEGNNPSLLLPFKTGEVMELSWTDRKLALISTDAFSPFLWPGDKAALWSVLANYHEKPAAEATMMALDTMVAVPMEYKPQFSDTVKIGDSYTRSIAPDSGETFYSFSWLSPPPKNSVLDLYEQTITWVPERKDIGVHLFAFRQENRTGEKVEQIADEYGYRHQLIPNLIEKETILTVVVKDTITVELTPNDSALLVVEEPRMFSLIVTVPSKMESDRFSFDGVSPFGIMVHESKEIAGTGKKLIGHDIIADLNRVARDSEVEFRYFSKDTSQKATTTLTIIHDLESNVMYMSVEPKLDTLPQSFHPEAWSSDLYGYPEYFFEGFPGTMKMDSVRQSLVFSFGEDVKTNILNSSVMMMSPLNPMHWLSLYMDEGALLEIRGEVKVKENQSKKIIIEIDFTGDFFPQMLRTRVAMGESELPPYSIPVTPLPVRDALPVIPAMDDTTMMSTEMDTLSEHMDSLVVPLPDSVSLERDEPDSLMSIMKDTLLSEEQPDSVEILLPVDSTASDTSGQ